MVLASRQNQQASRLCCPEWSDGALHFPIFHLPFHLPFCGGIAQLVERQLCKLDVRGSNPLASISPEMEATKRGITLDRREPNSLASKGCKAWRPPP